MNRDNITVATFDGKTETTTTPLYQWDYGQLLRFADLELPAAYEVHFGNAVRGPSTTAIGDGEGVSIPNWVLLSGREVHAWVFLHSGTEDGETEYHAVIPVIRRAQPLPEAMTSEQLDTITQAIAALQEAQRQTEAAAAAAQAQADAAEEEADSAASSASLAQSWAVGGTGSRTGEDTDNARFWASVAQQGAGRSGYAIFDVRDEDGHMYVTITDDLAADVSFQVNENTGRLEVTING